jgi:hypothetical protein
MRYLWRLLSSLLFVTLLINLSACGYKPSAKYAREVLGKKISTSVVISAQDPANTVIIKDAVDQSLIEVFHASLTDRKYSDSHLILSISEPRYTPVQYDANGYVIAYRATIHLGVTRISQDIQKKYKTTGTYDFSIVPNAVLTDQERFDAIKYSALKAISSFIAQISAEGISKK